MQLVSLYTSVTKACCGFINRSPTHSDIPSLEFKNQSFIDHKTIHLSGWFMTAICWIHIVLKAACINKENFAYKGALPYDLYIVLIWWNNAVITLEWRHKAIQQAHVIESMRCVQVCTETSKCMPWKIMILFLRHCCLKIILLKNQKRLWPKTFVRQKGECLGILHFNLFGYHQGFMEPWLPLITF